VGFDGRLWWALMVSSCIARIAQARLKGTSPAIISDSNPDQSVGFDGLLWWVLMVSRVPAWWAFMENQVGFSG
jgi:hypothetical protein